VPFSFPETLIAGGIKMNTKLSTNRKFKRVFANTLSIFAILAIAVSAAGFALQLKHETAQADSPIWRDEFDGPLADGWYWVNENLDKWNFGDGFLRIFASPYATGGENLLLRPAAQGDFMIKTRVRFEPNTNFQFAGLVIYQDDGNLLQLGRAFCDLEEICVGNGIYFDKILGGNFTDSNFAMPIGNPSEVFLRLERRGEMVRAFYSADEGISWYEIGTHWIPSDFQVNAVGLTASQDDSNVGIPADFDFFELTEGWGFLPEGFHDGEQGDVPSWACNASGWAADPDDRAADVNIEIVVDDQTAANLVAGEFRQDLLDAGVCVDGNCSFSTSLWGLISSYEPHRVDAWAQDDTGEWVLLNNSAKTLTCRTYDIYTFDPAAGTTVQITNLPDMHEFNPRWSPDAKKIVHDAWNVDWSAHGVYITDVKTGASTPLSDAEGGSYPTWSPNGKWIAFDRGADNDYRLFIVPPTGGVPKLVRDDAFMASWAPNSQRLAFHQPSDGSIRTIELKGGNETIVAERGNGPAWSPGGEWIAFEMDGDVWKVGVDNHGNPLGDPIRLTSSPVWEGRPTWSNNSKTIAFHAGMGQDTDIWTIPASGGTATWLTGAPVFGDYDANYSFNGQYIAYSSFSPDGQAARLWVAAYTYDPPAGTFSDGTHPYHFDFEWSVPEPGSWSGQGGEFVIFGGAEIRDGYVLLRGPEEIYGINYPQGLTCEQAGDINPNQSTRFLIGWLPDYGEIPYSEAQAHFNSIQATAVWDEGTAELVQHEIFPFREGDWFNYVCTFTEAPPKMDLRVNYGHDWVESFYEAGHTVSIQVTDSEGNVKATAEVFTEPKDFWGGETGFQTTLENWSPAPPDLQPYDWVYAEVDNGATAQVQLGDIRGEVRFDLDSVTGTIDASWLTDAVSVECLDWGSGAEPPYSNKDGGFHLTDGTDPYSCSWEGEWDVQPWQDIGVGYSTPDGHWVANAFRDERWMAMWTYDPPTGSLQEGEHSYYYDLAYTVPEYVDYPPMDPRTFTVSEETLIYGGYALLGPWDYMPVQVWNGSACEVVSALNPYQPIRFISGWVNDYSMTYEEALAHFSSITVDLSWNGEAIDSASFTMSELLPFTGRDARLEYLCTLTEHP
jgi:regulation of enolase protein 1 (concanavalin A-like superfamily)